MRVFLALHLGKNARIRCLAPNNVSAGHTCLLSMAPGFMFYMARFYASMQICFYLLRLWHDEFSSFLGNRQCTSTLTHTGRPQIRRGPRRDASRAHEAGLERILAIGSGTGPGTYDGAMKIARQHDWIYATPECIRMKPAGDRCRLCGDGATSRNPKMIAWGEIGLDYFYDHSPRDVQKEVFRRQMELPRPPGCRSSSIAAPATTVRTRGTTLCKCSHEHWAHTGLPGILHCFTGEWRHAQAALDIGFYISFAGNVRLPKAENIRDAAKKVRSTAC